MIQGLTCLEFNLFVKEQQRITQKPSMTQIGSFGIQLLTKTDSFIKAGIHRVQTTLLERSNEYVILKYVTKRLYRTIF